MGKTALLLGCAVFVIFFGLLGGVWAISQYSFTLNGGPTSTGTTSTTTGTGIDGVTGTETEFQVTTYYPGQGVKRTEGGYGLAAGEAIPDPSSPTGLKWSKSSSITGIIAVPQHSNAIPIVDLISEPWKQARIAIPCYNGGQPAVVADRFGSAGHASNRLDLAMDISKAREFDACIAKYSKGPGIEGSTKVIGKIVGTIIK